MAVGRKCTICNHKQKTEIDQAIGRGESLRAIALRFGIKTHMNVQRHTENCLQLTVGAIQQAQKEESRLTVVEEFRQQLAFARQVREAAMKVLEDPDDPLKLTLDVWAHEIDVVYFDYNDMTAGDNPKPKKKRAQLSTLLAMLSEPPDLRAQDEQMQQAVWAEWEEKGEGWSLKRSFDWFWDKARQYFMYKRQSLNLEAEKIHIKQTDLRKYLLETLSTADMTIDKLAKIDGVYKADQPNDAKARALDAIATALHMRPELDKRGAMEWILRQQREYGMVAIDPVIMHEIARDNGIMDLEVNLEVKQLEGIQ